jgi:hypothetical protein
MISKGTEIYQQNWVTKYTFQLLSCPAMDWSHPWWSICIIIMLKNFLENIIILLHCVKVLPRVCQSCKSRFHHFLIGQELLRKMEII